MGDMADADIEQGQELLWDHEQGHPNIEPTFCPYCIEEDNQ